jgi:phi13 family phage major tail protein
MAVANKVKYGLKSVHYAVITEGVGGAITYGTPKPIPGAVSMALTPRGESAEFHADDVEYWRQNTNTGYEGDLEMALIPDSFRIDVLGEIEDLNGAIVENANAVVKNFALLGEMDGDKHKMRFVLYNCLANRPNFGSTTTTATREPQVETLAIVAMPAIGTGDVKTKIKEGDTGYGTFFATVYLKDLTP